MHDGIYLLEAHIIQHMIHCVSGLQIAQWMSMELLWEPAAKYLPIGDMIKDGRLCRWYLTVSFGFLEPFWIFMGILVCRGLLR